VVLLFVPLGSLHIAIDAADYQICYDVSGALVGTPLPLGCSRRRRRSTQLPPNCTPMLRFLRYLLPEGRQHHLPSGQKQCLHQGGNQ